MRKKLRALIVALTVVALLGIAASAAPAATPKAAAPKLYVHAAASLYKAFPAMVAPFKAANPKYKSYQFVFNFQGTDVLVAQIEGGAPADVFAGASTKYGTQLFNDGFTYTPSLFVQNRLCVIVPKSNPAKIDSLDDLAKTSPAPMIAIGDAAVPIGTYTRTVLTNITTAGVYGATYYDDVMANVVANLPNVNMVSTLVAAGEVDAGFVYKSDALAANLGKVRVLRVAIPNAYQSNPLPTYPISRVKTSTQQKASAAFISFALSVRGQKILKSYGFLAKPKLLVSAVSPTSGAAGSTVTITGAGFGASGVVKFGDTSATTTTWTAKQISATVPASLAPGAHAITVTPAGGSASNATVKFTVTP
jgi:molybdate transport system substrate-binding protein